MPDAAVGNAGSMLVIKTEPLPAGLYLVATPIGNLRDISLRALDTIASADIVLAEDTRQSQKLLSAFQIQAKLSPYHDHNAAKRVPDLIKNIEGGTSYALISDAGTPLVSDPGYKLTRAVIDAGMMVTAIPGASAVLTGLSLSGLASDKFLFAGFLPPKSSARQSALSSLAPVPTSLVFFESAQRLEAALRDMLTVLGDRPAAIAREMTKRYEEVLRGSFSELLQRLETGRLKGEIVVIVGPPQASAVWDDEQIDQALAKRISDIGVKRASAEISVLSGRSKKEVYARAIAIKDQAGKSG